MNVRQLDVFAEAGLDNSIKLAVALDLVRLYSPLVTEPIPPNLRSYIDRLETMEKRADEPARSTCFRRSRADAF
jgi:hypothetical protein